MFVEKQAAISVRTHYATMRDDNLIRKCQQRDKLAFETLMMRYKKIIEATLFRIAPDSKNREELIQEVMIRVFSNINFLKNPFAFNDWLKQIIKSVYCQSIQGQTQNTYHSIVETLDHEEDHSRPVVQSGGNGMAPDELVERREIAKQIERAVEKLPEDYKTALMMRVHGLPYSEIACKTNAEIGTVKSRICKARLQVQSSLFDYIAS